MYNSLWRIYYMLRRFVVRLQLLIKVMMPNYVKWVVKRLGWLGWYHSGALLLVAVIGKILHRAYVSRWDLF